MRSLVIEAVFFHWKCS